MESTMRDQRSSSPTPDDSQGQPREDAPSINRWLAQPPREDGVPFTFNLGETHGNFTEETRSGGQDGDDDISVDYLHHVAGCQVTNEKNWSLANHIPPYHHQNTKGDSGQPSSNAHDTSQSENSFAHQQQGHLRHALFSSSGQETLEQPFNQASLGPLETADHPGNSYGVIQQNNEVDQWLDTPDATCFHNITYDRRRALLQLYGKVQQELSTIDSASGSQQPFAPESSEFDSILYPSHGYSVNSTSVTHTTESFSRLDTSHPRRYYYNPPHHPGLIPLHSSTNPALLEPLRYGCTTTPSYSSDTHSRAMDEVSSEMTFPTTPTTNRTLYRNNFVPYHLDPTHVAHLNPANITKPASDSLEAQCHGSESPAHHSTRRLRPGQHGTSGRKSKRRRICKTNEDEHDIHAYNCPFYLQNPSDYGEGTWELCAKGRWKTYQRMREHLLRKHIRPAIICVKCFEEFEADDRLQEHLELQCKRKAHSPYLSTEQQSQLQTRVKGGMKEAEKLEQIYSIFSINGAFPISERSRQIRLETSLRSAIAFSSIPPRDIERITNDTLQAIQRASSTVRVEHEHNPQECDGFDDVLAASSSITEYAPVGIAHNSDDCFLQLGN